MIMNTNTTDELEMLRKELSAFKERLDKQVTVGDKMLRKAMHSKIMWIRNCNVYITVAGLIMLPLVAATVYLFTHSLLLTMTLCIGAIAEALYNAINTRGMKDLSTGALLATSRRMLRFKRNEKLAMAIEVPALIVWLALLTFCMFRNHSGNAQMLSSIYVMLVGFVLGLVFFAWMFRKEMRLINETVKEIEEFTEQ